MHLRKLVLACGFASFALSNYASALGLGEVKLKSTLNQPLSAEVQLLDTKGLSPEQIIVSLASSTEFERNGLDFVHFYTEFKFEVALDNPSGPVVRITSRNPVREPYLNFLVEAKWTSGRLLREYTLLMDLPTYDDAAPQAVQAAKTAPAKPAVTPPPATKTEVTAPVTQAPAEAVDTPEEKPDIIAEQDQPAKKSKVASGTYGPVGDKDTLWEIALAVRPDSSASVHQTMLALQRLNPDAFIRGNINLLKKGQVLRVPDSSEISSVSQSEAVRQFNAQSAEWSGNSVSPSDSGLGAQLDASRRTNTERAKSEAVTGRVRLEAPTAKEKAAGGQGSGANKGSGKALESELASTLEELERAKSEKTELSSRVHDLEEQVKTMQRLVDVSNEKLRALQLNSGKQPDKSATADKKAADAKPAETTPADTKTSAAAANTSAAATAAVSSAAASVAPKKPVVKPTPAPEPEKTIVDQIFDNILWVGLGAAVLLGAGGVALARRRKAEAEQNNSATDDFSSDEPNFDSFNQTHEEESALEPTADEMALFDEEGTTAVAETGDVVGEADIYIAYGKFDQAEEMLVNGLAKDPASTDIRLKLLEVYSHTQNATAFDKHYAALLPLASGFALSRAKELRASIPDIGEFNPDTAQASQPEEKFDFNEDFNLDDFDVEPETPAPAVSTSVATDSTSDDFDFDLELDDTNEFASDFSAEAKKPADLDDDFTLDFDLDDAPAKHGEAEDLSEISLALDSLDDDGLPEDVEVSKREEDEFSFDFNELDNEPSSLAQEANSIKSAEFNEEAVGDDFNLEMDVNDVALAALDDEMASLDAELDLLDDEDSTAPSTKNEFASLDEDEFKLDDVDSELADLDSSLDLEDFDAGDEFDEIEAELNLDDKKPESQNFVAENSTEQDELLDTELDESEFSWEEDEVELEAGLEESAESELLSEEDLSVDDDDDFDIDGSVELADDVSLEDLDEALAEESADEIADLDENAFAELDDELLDEELDVEAADVGELDLSDAETELAAEDLDLEESLFAEEEVPVEQEDLAQLDNIDEEAIQEVAEANNAIEDDISDDDVFEQALSDFSAESLAMDDAADMSEDDMDAELDFMADADEAATKLDLARAYMDMGDNEGARDILAEVAHEGNDQQRQEAADLLSRIDA
ncbi:motility protein FimV [Cellvibrio zantedeschiae]|uniref:Motility protein FimV n=1 Tax=Cellvibrio zantedeschiae TaxID=1237077 RepID=A0ABQ3B111_9GAMM|nr:FimV/HubP family polar landmark protein [Cellvibrio zantedeschiae]GGY73064.1 motility protein FimV [Cellvibrio zantedeschiae]